ncbi:hypothetical protein R50072_37120 [Simiduia litorea]|uniref:hypothetical protein n=1 Tax=Simiduia litorea TaxID=1435348 RepID=UPI0036F3E0E5
MKGVVSYLELTDKNTVRLIFDDVASNSGDRISWIKELLFTHHDYDLESLKELDLSEQQYAQIGENLVIRLLALKSGGV